MHAQRPPRLKSQMRKSKAAQNKRAPLKNLDGNERRISLPTTTTDIQRDLLQMAKEPASSRVTGVSDSTLAHQTSVQQPKTKHSSRNSKRRKARAKMSEKVLPSIEKSNGKHLKSGVQYSSREVGAGKIVDHCENNVTGRNGLSSHPSSGSVMSAREFGLNSALGKELDEYWMPSSEDCSSAQTLAMLGNDVYYEQPSYLPPLSTSELGHDQPTISAQVTDNVKSEFEVGMQLLRRSSPAVWNPLIRNRNLERDGVVEVPKEVLELERLKMLMKAKQKAIKAQIKIEKGKYPEQINGSAADDLVITGVKRKFGDAEDSTVLGEAPGGVAMQGDENATSHCKSSGNVESTPISEKQGISKRTTQIQPRNNSHVQGQQQGDFHDPSEVHRTPTHHRRHRRNGQTYEKFLVPKHHRQECTCDLLPSYFVQNQDFIPSLKTWPGSRLEFLVHVDQLSKCLAHSPFVRDACRRILQQENYPSCLRHDPAIHSVSNSFTRANTTSLAQQLQTIKAASSKASANKGTGPKAIALPCITQSKQLKRVAPLSHNSHPTLPSTHLVQRYQSMPAPTINGRDMRSHVRRETEYHNTDALLSAVNTIAEKVNQMEIAIRTVVPRAPAAPNAQPELQHIANPHPPPPPPSAPAATVDVATQGEPSRKRRKTAAEQQADDKPTLSRNVPQHQRRSNRELLAIGKNPHAYERHRLAPYAFSWAGRLYADYDYLLGVRDHDGNQVWNYKLAARLKS